MMVGDQPHASAVVPPEKSPGTPWTGGWAGSRAGIEKRKMFASAEIQAWSRQTPIKSL
jgi:hypothetical protein